MLIESIVLVNNELSATLCSNWTADLDSVFFIFFCIESCNDEK